MADLAALTKAGATDLARRISLDDLHARAGARQRPDGGWYVVVTLADQSRVEIASWDDWTRRREVEP